MHYISRGLRVNVYIFFTVLETELEGRSEDFIICRATGCTCAHNGDVEG